MEGKEIRGAKKSKIKIILLIPLAIIVLGVIVITKWQYNSTDNNASLPHTVNSPLAPNFTFPTLGGRSVSLSDYRGKVVLVNIWATWCPPCRAETPSLEKLYQRFKSDDKFKLLAVSIDEAGGSAIRPFMKRNHLNFPVLVDRNQSIMGLYGATGVPETFIVRKDGSVDSHFVGAYDWTSPKIVEHIKNLIKQ